MILERKREYVGIPCFMTFWTANSAAFLKSALLTIFEIPLIIAKWSATYANICTQPTTVQADLDAPDRRQRR